VKIKEKKQRKLRKKVRMCVIVGMDKCLAVPGSCFTHERTTTAIKTWEYSNITQPLISYERGWPLACLEDLIKPNQASHRGAR
jgi:hypothetical protein